jgi:hypothetical protein
MVKRYSSHDYTESETGWLVPKADYDALVATLRVIAERTNSGEIAAMALKAVGFKAETGGGKND